MLLLVNLQLTTDDGSLSIGFGEVAAQSYWEEELPEVVVTGNAYEECNLCHQKYLKRDMEQHQGYECPERLVTCDICHKPYKYSESHTCDTKEGYCVFCSKPFDQCTCNGPVILGSGSGGSPGSYGGGTAGSIGNSNIVNNQYSQTNLTIFKDALKKALKDTKKEYGNDKACNIGVQKAFYNIYQNIPQEIHCKANEMITRLRNSAKWEKITLNEASSLAAKGCFVIAGWYNKNGSGHVVVGHPYSGPNGNLKVMDCGPKPVGKNECQGWNYSFGPKKRNKVEFFVYKKNK